MKRETVKEGRDDLAHRARELLAPFSHRRTFEPGDLIFREGDDDGMLVATKSGRVKIYRVLPNGNAVTLYLFGPGDVFGFMPFLDGRPYPASAQALEAVTALVMPRSALVGAFERDPKVALALVQLLATRSPSGCGRRRRGTLNELRIESNRRCLQSTDPRQEAPTVSGSAASGAPTEEIPMIDAREFLKAGQLLHGHKCPAMPLGLRAGAAAMNALAVARAKDKDLVAIVELGDDHCAHCFADGVQMITGCTFGKGNIRKLGYGKFAVTVVERTTGRSVRVVPRAQAQMGMKQTRFFQEYRMRGVPASKVPDEVVEPLVQQVMNAPEDQILSVGPEHKVEVEEKGETFATAVCDTCGEVVVETYLRVAGEKRLCIPCQAKLV